MELDDVEPAAVSDLNDSGFEPQSRLRANTWPVRPSEFCTPSEDTSSNTPPVSDSIESALEISNDETALSLTRKKGGTRRNAWGSLSYADLITKAIESSSEKRQTLSQIYDWMVQNVPYFKDKGDNNSSAGWKNSIRHNLSLHNRFMRVQNEGTGKSSWWILNPDAKPGKTPRRRAASMDPKEMAKKRGRAKKHVEQLRTGGDFENYRQLSNPGSEYSSASDLSSINGDPFSLSPHHIRARTESNASSFGRLSPIQAGVEPEIDDGFGSSWGDLPNGMTDRHLVSGTESVSEHLAELFMGDSMSIPDIVPSYLIGKQQKTQMSSMGIHEQGCLKTMPSAYTGQVLSMQSQRSSYGTVRQDGLGSVSSVSMSPHNVADRSVSSSSDSFAACSAGYIGKVQCNAMPGLSLRDLLSENSGEMSSSFTHNRQQDFARDVKYLQDCAIPPNHSLPSPNNLARASSNTTSMASLCTTPIQLHQPMMAGGTIASAILQQQQQQHYSSTQQQYNNNLFHTLQQQQRMLNDNLLQAVQMKGMRAQILRSPGQIKQEPASYPASSVTKPNSQPLSPVSYMSQLPVNASIGSSRSIPNDMAGLPFIKQENTSMDGLYGASRNCAIAPPPPPLPMDLDFTIQELRAGGLECDVDRILQEGNFDVSIEFQS